MPEDYAAKVGDTYLTYPSIDSALGTYKMNKKFRAEYIREWIEKELLFREAVDEEITEEEDFINILDESRKELAGVMLIDKYVNEHTPEFTKDELRFYYEKNLDEFRISEISYVINYIEFTDEIKAINFRSILVESGWNPAINVFHDDKAIKRIRTGEYLTPYNISDDILIRVLQALNSGEVSIILDNIPGVYTIIQMVEIIQPDKTPDFKYIENRVKERYSIFYKNRLYKNYLEELYSKYEVEFAEK